MKSKLEGEGPAQVRDSELDPKITGQSLQHLKQEGVVFRVHCKSSFCALILSVDIPVPDSLQETDKRL